VAELCTIPACPFYGRYCRLHQAPKSKPVGRKNPASGYKTPIQKWYEEKIKHCKWICEECGQSCFSNDKQYQYAAQAHLLPKSLFPSAAVHPLNYACLGPSCGCHGRYDSNWSNASKMKIWQPSLQIIYILIPLLWPEEYRKLPDIIADPYEDRTKRLIEAGEIQTREAYLAKENMKLKRIK
jgi:hypothetical protein